MIGIGRLNSSTQTSNAATAAQQADVYLARAYLPRRLAKDAEQFAAIAKRHQLPVLLANHVSTTGGWNAAGELTVKANGTQPSLVFCHIHHGAISGSVEVMTNLLS